MDVESAFLNGKVKSEVHVKQSQGYDDNSRRVCKVNKALYGLRESPRAWYECLDKYLIELVFEKSKIDYCLYFIKIEIISIDDLLICGKNKKLIDFIKKKLSVKFRMKDMGQIKTYLGINIHYGYNNNIMTLDQKDYIEFLARKYDTEPALSASNDKKYRNLITALLYISSSTRPDICYSVNYL